MLGKEPRQRTIYTADSSYLEFVGPQTFYGLLAEHRQEWFPDEQFAGLYVEDNGRPSVSPNLLATTVLLQTYDGVSDAEAIQRSRYDLRWLVALGREIGETPFAKSTLQRFRSLLILHEEYRQLFQVSLRSALDQGLIGKGKLKLALDTTPVFGRGAVKDTYNLLADGIKQLSRELAHAARQSHRGLLKELGMLRYLGSSIKGESDVDWSDEASIRQFLTGIVADADQLLALTRTVREGLDDGSETDQKLVAASEILRALLLQDVERKDDGTSAIKRGVAKDRIVSVTDPEMRHGHKSASHHYDGHKAAIAVDAESQVITAVQILPGNAHDHTGALEMVAQSEQNTGCDVAKTIGDCAYGDHQTRQRFTEAGRELIARVPKPPNTGFYVKSDFVIDLETSTITCPEGHTTTHFETVTKEGKLFQFPKDVCAACPVRTRCVKSPTHGRTIFVHRQEDQTQKARAYQKTDAFTEDIQTRQVVEHRIARLMQLNMRKSKFYGRAKTLFQLVMAATVANFTRIFQVTRKTGQKRQPLSLAALITTMATALIYRRRAQVTPPPRYAMTP
jgi:hypothetical protein